MKQLLTLLLAILVLFSCQKAETPSAKTPEIPPLETMLVDFSGLIHSNKSGEINQNMLTKHNWGFSALTVGFWNILIGSTFAIPVASFKVAFGKQPVKIDENTWQWAYDVDGFTSTYTARLVGTNLAGQVKWEMYITKTGVDSFDEFLWFEGISAKDGQNGQWFLYHSADFPEKAVQIDWEKEVEEVAKVQYTYVRELDDNRNPENFFGSYLIYGVQEAEFDAYVSIHAYNKTKSRFTDAAIEWSRANFSGRIKAEHLFNDTDWHCWDTDGNDMDCN